MILGIDPGFASCGYALLSPVKGERESGPCFTSVGVIRTQKTQKKIPLWEDNTRRTGDLYGSLKTVLVSETDSIAPVLFAIEAESWTRMPSDKLLGMARGAIYSLAFERGGAVEQYGPKELKKEFCGTGSASKTELEEKLIVLHPELEEFLNRLPKTQRSHAADAAACAVYAHRNSNYARILRAARRSL
tara:strand:+ start:11736 stop:12302 length:567 start_codon:yes stop_codon:yes gene_type:complete